MNLSWAPESDRIIMNGLFFSLKVYNGGHVDCEVFFFIFIDLFYLFFLCMRGKYIRYSACACTSVLFHFK